MLFQKQVIGRAELPINRADTPNNNYISLIGLKGIPTKNDSLDPSINADDT